MDELKTIHSFISDYWRVAAAFFLIYLIIRKSKLIRIDWHALNSFTTFLVITFFVRLFAHISLIKSGHMHLIPVPPKQVLEIDPTKFFLVGLEDIFFVVIPYLLTRDLKSKIAKVLIWLPFIAFFGNGHSYQGSLGVIFSIAMIHVAYKYGKAHGFGTTMVGHFLYDSSTYLLIKIVQIMMSFNVK